MRLQLQLQFQEVLKKQEECKGISAVIVSPKRKMLNSSNLLRKSRLIHGQNLQK
jgi:hypothetical protein